MKNRHFLKKIQDTRNIVHKTMKPLPYKVGILGPHTALPITLSCSVIFSWISWMIWNLLLTKGDCNFGKSQKSQGPKSGQYGSWVTWVIRCFTRKPCVSHDAWVGALLWRSRQSSVAQSCSFLNHANSFHGEIFKLNAKFDTDSLFYLLSHFECDGHTVHMLTQRHLPPPMTSTVKSSLFTHVHSSPLP